MEYSVNTSLITTLQ